MNHKHAFAAAVIAFASSAVFADIGDELQHFGASQPEASSTTRATGKTQATAEADVAGVSPKATKTQASGLTRTEVRAEVMKAQAAGHLARPSDLYVSDNYPVASVRTREEVRAEAIAAKAAKAAGVQTGH